MRIRQILCVLFGVCLALPAVAAEKLEADVNTVLLYHFDQNSSDTIVLDSSSYQNDGALRLSPLDASGDTDPIPSAFWTTSHTGLDTAGQASDGVNEPHIIIVENGANANSPYSLNIWTQNLSIEFWMKAPEVESGWILYKGGTYAVTIGDSNVLAFYNWDGQHTFINDFGSTHTAGQWYHIMITVDKQSTIGPTQIVSFFTDGELTNRWETPRSNSPNSDNLVILNKVPPYGWYNQAYPTLDELRISDTDRSKPPEGTINWVKKNGNDLDLEFRSFPRELYRVQSADDPGGPWTSFATLGASDTVTPFTITDALLSGNKKFFRVATFTAESMGYPVIQSKSPTVDGDLSEWTSADKIATRDNWFAFIRMREMANVKFDVYGAYNDTENAFYFAFDVTPLETGGPNEDYLSMVFSNPWDSSSAAEFIGFPMNPATEDFSFQVMDLDVGNHHVKIKPPFSAYEYADFIAEGGAFAQVGTPGSHWKVEIKVPYSFISTGYSFDSGDSCTVHFTYTNDAFFPIYDQENGTTNPNRTTWPEIGDPIQWKDPEVGVRRL